MGPASLFRQKLSEYSVDDIEKAATSYGRIGDKFPLVSDFIRLLSA